MSQNVSSNPKEREPLTSPPPSQPWSAETEADKLMDELFADIDSILEGGNRLPTEPAKPEYVSLKPMVIPQLSMPPAVQPPQEEGSQQPSLVPTESKPKEALETQLAPKTSTPPRSGWSVERLLLVLGFVVLGASLLLLLASKKKLMLPDWVKPSTAPPAPKSQVSPGDAEFANYMERALKAIDNKIKVNPQATPPASGTSATNPAPIPAPSNSQPSASQPQRVIERVYIPVYPPQTPVAPGVPPSVARPSVPNLRAPAPSRSVKPSLPSPTTRGAVPSSPPAVRRVAPNPSPVAKAAAPSPSPVAKAAAPSLSPAAKRTAPASSQSVARAAFSPVLPPLPSVPPSVKVPTAPVAQAPTSATKHTLVGVMEQGDRSAALFTVGDAAKYIYIGEAIGDTGWTLVSVANQEAVIRRNGEVRSIYAGQSF